MTLVYIYIYILALVYVLIIFYKFFNIHCPFFLIIFIHLFIKFPHGISEQCVYMCDLLQSIFLVFCSVFSFDTIFLFNFTFFTLFLCLILFIK